MSKLAKKVAFVTGGSRGIGAAIAKRLAADGASVAITYAKDASAASAVVKAIELRGGKAIAIQADAANVEAVKGAVEKAFSTFGRLDVLVNNAGTAIPKTFEEATLEEMDRVIDINLTGLKNCLRSELRYRNQRGCSIVNGASVSGQLGNAYNAAYGASKGGVIALTLSVAHEVSHLGVRINAIAP